MEIKDKIIAITGAGRGLGAGMALEFAKQGAKAVCISDINEDDIAASVAAIEATGCKALGLTCDVSREDNITNMIDRAETELGPIDLFIANAGVGFGDGVPGDNSLMGPAWQQSNDQWQASWNINLMQSVWAARAVVPKMTGRGGGYFITVASAAGLLGQIGDTAYTVTKHAARAFAESLAIAHGDEGLQVSCICPQYVDTKMARMVMDSGMAFDNVLSVEDFAAAVVKGIQDGKFFILPHPQVKDYVQAKYADQDRWLGGMRKMRRAFTTPKG